MNPVRYIAVGFLVAHALWCLAFLLWGAPWLRRRAQADRQHKAATEYAMVRDTLRYYRHQWN